MVGLAKNVSEIAYVTNYRGRSLASDDVCSKKTGNGASPGFQVFRPCGQSRDTLLLGVSHTNSGQ